MKDLFDYVYYRVKKKFYRKDSEGIFAACCVSFIQVIGAVDLLALFSKLFYTREQTAPHAKTIAQIVAFVLLVVIIINFRKYYKKYWQLQEQWKDETESQKTIRGWLVFFAVLTPLVVLILVGVFL